MKQNTTSITTRTKVNLLRLNWTRRRFEWIDFRGFRFDLLVPCRGLTVGALSLAACSAHGHYKLQLRNICVWPCGGCCDIWLHAGLYLPRRHLKVHTTKLK